MSIFSGGRWLPVLLLAEAIAFPAAAHDYHQGTITISHPWARATAPRAEVGGAYLILHNDGKKPDRLISASSPRAAKVEIHSMTMDGGIMRMRPLPGGISVPPNGEAKLAPDGNHIMLIGLKAPLHQGDAVPLTLSFEHAGKVTVSVTVEGAGAEMGGGMGHMR